MSLAAYDIDPVHGFVPGSPPLRRLPAAFDPWEALVPDLSALIRSRRIRPALAALPELDTSVIESEGALNRAMVLLCHFANCWVWGGVEPNLRIPSPVAKPLWALHERLGRPPIAHYASMTLTNWQLLDEAAPLSVDNARTQVRFLGGVDEDWFFIASMGVELAGAPLLPVVAQADALSRDGSDADLAVTLGQFADGMGAIMQALGRIREWCDPSTYYLRVRPYVTGWPAPGVVYEGVSEEPRRFIGGSAGQSSLLQSFDAVLGLAHAEAPAGAYLRAVRAYMPPRHRAFVEDLERTSRVRPRAQAGSTTLRDAYNAALGRIDEFRQAHMQLAHDFIVRPAGHGEATGTGGTALTSFLKGAQHTTSSARL